MRDYLATVAAIWELVLGHPTPTDVNFFDAGGDSLLLLEVHAKLEAELGRDVALVDLLQYPTVSGLAAALAGSPR